MSEQPKLWPKAIEAIESGAPCVAVYLNENGTLGFHARGNVGNLESMLLTALASMADTFIPDPAVESASPTEKALAAMGYLYRRLDINEVPEPAPDLIPVRIVH